MNTGHLSTLTAEEGVRKTQKLMLIEKKGVGYEEAGGRADNGDIVKWTKIGKMADDKGDRFARNTKQSERERYMQSVSTWSSDLKAPKPRERRDFEGSGNIINWMS